MSNLAIIQQVYAAFESADLDTVLALVDPDCTITQDPALPWGGEHHGTDGAATFAITLAGTISSTVTVNGLFEAGDRVIQYGHTHGTVIATGAAFDVPEVHVWTLRDGKIIAAEFYIESSAMLVALGSPA